jgi:hypothetical protein
MSAGWQIHSEARVLGKDPSSSTLDCPDEEAAREEFGAFRHRVKAGGPDTIHWTIQLRHGAEVVEEFKGTQGPSTV